MDLSGDFANKEVYTPLSGESRDSTQPAQEGTRTKEDYVDGCVSTCHLDQSLFRAMISDSDSRAARC